MSFSWIESAYMLFGSGGRYDVRLSSNITQFFIT